MQTFAVDFRSEPLGGESLVAATLYPLLADQRLVRLSFPQAYTQHGELNTLTEKLHIHLQRSRTERNRWLLVILMDQTVAPSDPAWGSLSHQIHALRQHVLSPLEDEYGQRPTLTLGLVLDHWDRETQTQIPTSDDEFLQWSIDHFGMIPVDPSSGESPVSEQLLSQHPHLLRKADQRVLQGSPSESEIDELFSKRIEGCRSLRGKARETATVFPPARDADRLDAIRERLLASLGQSGVVKSSPSEILQSLAHRHLSALGQAVHHQRNDLVLVRIPVRSKPLHRRQRDLMRLDYVLGALPLLSGPDLKEELASINDEILAYWVGSTRSPDEASRIHLSDDKLCSAARTHHTHLQEAIAALDLERLGEFKVELFEPFDHSCGLQYPDDWRSTVSRLNEFSFVRSAPVDRWSRWVDTVDDTIHEKHNHLSSRLSECLVESRQQWDDSPTRVHEGSDIDALVAERQREYEAKREGIFAEPSEGFVNDWTERADAYADDVRRAFQLRPTRQHLGWALGITLVLLLLSLLLGITGSAQRLLSIGVWTGVGLLVLGSGFFFARRRLIAFITERTKRATDEAKSVFHELHNFVQHREAMVEQYFEALTAKRNLERARHVQRHIEAKRVRHRYHQQALREHEEDADMLGDFLSCPGSADSSSDDETQFDLDGYDSPPFTSPLYALQRSQVETIDIFGAETDTRLLPGLQKIEVVPDPAFQVQPFP